MKVARAGQQSGNESIALAKVVPCAASRRLTLGIRATSVAAMSSVMITRMFGRESLPAPAGRAWTGPARSPSEEHEGERDAEQEAHDQSTIAPIALRAFWALSRPS